MIEIKDFVGNVLRVGDRVVRARKWGQLGLHGRLTLVRPSDWRGTPSTLGKNTAVCDPDKCVLLERAP